MPNRCEKDFALHINPPGQLFDYWDFDAGPPYSAQIDPIGHQLGSAVGGVGFGFGILNGCTRIQGTALNNTSSVETPVIPGLTLNSGLTWSTWLLGFGGFGTGQMISYIFEAHFLNAADVEVFSFNAGVLPGGPPNFIVFEKNGSSFFSPTATFSQGVWYLVIIQFDPATKKLGLNRAVLPGGFGGLEESVPVVEDLSTITKGYIKLHADRGAISGAASDYQQDESGLWTRLLTAAELNQLWSGGGGPGMPPFYPNIPQ